MALPLEDTLETARQKVLLRCGMAQQGSHNANLQPVIDEFIRAAHHMFFHEVEWQALRSRKEITLIDGQQEYDFPDESDIGLLTDLYVVDNDDSPYGLEQSPTPSSRWNWSDTASRPVWYEILDQAIRIYPKPDITEYPTLVISYLARESTLSEDTDRLQVDSDLVVQQATVDAKLHLHLPGTKQLQDQVAYLLRSIKAQHASGVVINLAGYPRRALYGSRYEPPHRNYNWAGSDTYYEREYVDQHGRLTGG